MKLSRLAKAGLLSALKPLDIAVTRRSSLESLRAKFAESERLRLELWDRCFIESQPEPLRPRLRELLGRSRSQIRQDLFVLAQLNFKRNGYFVEFGACDGGDGSNTLLLESDFAWNGILAEPARVWHQRLLNSGRRARVSTKCVWSRSGETITFNETDLPALSTIRSFSGTDRWASQRSKGHSYEVETISLNDLLTECKAPLDIDYISIDTEGSELEILRAFDFSKYRVSVITCEHNFTGARDRIRELLEANGYARRLQELSRFDDWYVRQSP